MSSGDCQAVLEAIHGCDWLAAKLSDLVVRHEQAAAIARREWTGPHHDTFEERFASVQRELEAGRVWVFSVRHEAELVLAELRAEALVFAEGLSRTGTSG